MLNKITLCNFRNHPSLRLDGLGKLVIIKGDNAVGKTNIIEAIQLITMIESFRHPKWYVVCYQNKQYSNQEEELCSTIKAQISVAGRDLDIQMNVRENRRQYYLQGNKRNPNELKGLMPAVLFTPDDLNLVKSSSGARRDQIDMLGTQLSNTYANLLQEYVRILKQRNRVLKEVPPDYSLLDAWDEHIVVLGAKVYLHRKKLFLKVLEVAVRIYQGLAGEILSGEYLPGWGVDNDLDIENIVERFRNKLVESRELDIVAGSTKIGPHRDELRYFLDGKDARVFASQGQQRTIALALKLAERELILQIKGVEPIVLLDDVMSELDEKRRQALLQSLNTSAQTFITTTNLGYFNEVILQSAQLIELPLTGV